MKIKYHRKTLTDSAIYSTYVRLLDVEPEYASTVWLQISVFDLSELGLGLLYSIVPTEWQPYAIDFTFETPSVEEMLQGIWAKFKPVDFEKLYIWMTNFREYIMENIKPEFQASLMTLTAEKAIYGVTPYGRGVYDPVVAREFLRSTFQKLRLMRTPDMSWKEMLDHISEFLGMIGVTDEITYNRLMLLFSAQRESMVLGLSLLGYSKLSEKEGDYAKIPFMDARGNIWEVKFKTLDHLQMGFILGVTPLGYGVLLPKESIYNLPEGKKNPTFLKVLDQKVRGMIGRLTLTTWAYTNYHKPEEMRDVHRSDKANQYALLQTLRRHVEDWVRNKLPVGMVDAVTVRAYQNAVLQLITWKAKRHKWGFLGWEAMTDEQFKDWWLQHWERQGLNKTILQSLYEGVEPWLKATREYKLQIGKKIKQIRQRLALV
jgi:hypothetical protein